MFTTGRVDNPGQVVAAMFGVYVQERADGRGEPHGCIKIPGLCGNSSPVNPRPLIYIVGNSTSVVFVKKVPVKARAFFFGAAPTVDH